ncbi:ATP-binding protein [Aquitalea pelogenes]|uniref:ATP-binding protein n=1 Tax=Aquitalea pelogenes TaxID=1293573 RepID=UPI000B232E6D|nr:ATP-binding protein [Aquitalea pelogenes]
MLRRLAGSLLFRLIVLVVVVVVTTQVVTVYIAAGERHKLMDKQLYAQVVDTLAFLEGSMENMSPAQRTAFLASYNRPGLPRLLPQDSAPRQQFDKELPRVADSLVSRLSKGLGDTVHGYMVHREDRNELWVNVHVLDTPYWLVIPFGRYSDRPIYSLIQAALLATVLAILLASVVAWRITRPISKVVDASRELAGGKLPSPLAEDGPRELIALARGFNHMASALDNAARERRLMLAGLSHDLRTPLTRLKLMLELQDSSPDTPDMLADIDELSRIVRQFIDFARAEESARLEPVALAELADSVVARFGRSGLDVHLDRLAEPELYADALALERLLSNLLENARRYGKPPIRVEVASQDNMAMLSVIDHGAGIPAALRESALAPFERLAEHRGTDGGSGLGLAIVSRVVKQHHGQLRFVDEADGGFRVCILLPLTTAAATA